MRVSRRLFLQAAAGLTLAPSRVLALRRRVFEPVQVDPSRVIRNLVGLRPYRSSGFVVRAQSLGSKTVVHNYGHGGAGITLSWGTSTVAVELAWETGCRKFAVLGCGVVGLSTARLLQQRGAAVTIYARDLPPDTTSNIAGGQFAPALVADKRSPEWRQQFTRALQISHRAYQNLLGDEYGVRWLENYILSEKPPEHPLFPQAVEPRDFSPSESPFAGYYARRFTTMMIEPALYLRRLSEDFLKFGGRLVVRHLPDRDSLGDLHERVLLNCTGLGSRSLFGDEELKPVRGQLTVLLPQPEVDYATLGPADLYMFPRRDGIILGGTHQSDNWSLDPNPETTREILEGHTRLFRPLSEKSNLI